MLLSKLSSGGLKELEMVVAQAGWRVKWEGQVKYGVSG